ncbi:MAG: sulfatase-like hydrolase/transferase, partial [Actinomycetota bacterium]|nr:sulfatase-like hydrolase/transferase [Actinomycetota bacterium]
LDDTFVFVLSDNGYSFGEHRWAGKRCPYEACVRIPFAVHSPGADGGERPPVVSIVDLAPTILSVAGVASPGAFDGEPFVAWIEPRVGSSFERRNEDVYLEWHGDARIPAWTAVRTADLKLVRYEDGFEELYDIGGRIGSPDPWEVMNRVADPRYAGALARLRRFLDGHLGAG